MKTIESAEVLKSKLPSQHNWRTSDEDEINKRRYRALTESLRVRNLDPNHPVFSNYEVKSERGLSYSRIPSKRSIPESAAERYIQD